MDADAQNLLRYIIVGRVLEKSQPERFKNTLAQAASPLGGDTATAFVGMFVEKHDPKVFAELTEEIMAAVHYGRKEGLA